jgi:hypothetical protein
MPDAAETVYLVFAEPADGGPPEPVAEFRPPHFDRAVRKALRLAARGRAAAVEELRVTFRATFHPPALDE